MKHTCGIRSNNLTPLPAKVEAEAEHLRHMEDQDYRRMEGIIRRRLYRDSEDFQVSLVGFSFSLSHSMSNLIIQVFNTGPSEWEHQR